MADASTSLLVISDVITTSLQLLNTIYVLANFLDFIRDPTIFRFMATLREKWIPVANKFNNMTS